MTVYVASLSNLNGPVTITGNMTTTGNITAGALTTTIGNLTSAGAVAVGNGYAQLLVSGSALPTTVPQSLYICGGVPPAGMGSNGDFALRGDGTEAAHTILYHKEAGAWVASAA
jgi:hypothetical protein